MNVLNISAEKLAGMIDHTLLKANARKEDFERLCQEAVKYGFKSVMVNSGFVPLCRDLLKNKPVLVGATVSFPLGQCSIETKIFEAINAIEAGAAEIDYVINISRMKDGDLAYIREEMARITEACHKANAVVKAILETCYLEPEEIRQLCQIALNVRPDFIKTSTGFGPYGARLDDLAIMKETVGDAVKIKASGGIRDLKSALEMIKAGADRIGTSSGVNIIEEYYLQFRNEV